MCTTVLPWGKYAYQRLFFGLSIGPDVFQHRMDELFGDLPFVKVFIDDICIFSKGDLNDHMEKIRVVLDRLREANLQINMKKSKFIADELKYLGFIISPQGIRVDEKKVEAINQIAIPKNKKELRQLLGMVNYIRQSVRKHSQHTAILSDLLSDKQKFVWTDEHTQSFTALKKAIMEATMLSYPKFGEEFIIHTDSSKRQIGSVIFQKDKEDQLRPIAFFSKKLSPTERRYHIMEQELYAIVQTLSQYRTMLFGQKITVYTDHKNLTFERFASDRVNRWRLFTEEYGPTFHYMPGKDNVVADALSRLPMIGDKVSTEEAMVSMTDVAPTVDEVLEANIDRVWDDDIPCPIAYHVIQREQQGLAEEVKQNAKQEMFGTSTLLTNDKGLVILPESLQRNTIVWYHLLLQHPGYMRLCETLKLHFTWPGMMDQAKEYTKRCDACQRNKTHRPNYGKLPEPIPSSNIAWDCVAVDCVGPWAVTTRTQELTFRALTIIDMHTRWFEMVTVPDFKAETISLAFDRTWLSRYPRPAAVIHDQGTEFSKEFRELCESYGIKQRIITVRNPQGNSIIERTHLQVGNMLRAHDLEAQVLPNDEFEGPFDGIVSNISFAMRSAYHTTLKTTPAHMAFGRDMLFPKTTASASKQATTFERALKDQQRNNENRINHDYAIGDLILVRRGIMGEQIRKISTPTEGPYKVTQVYTNGTVRIERNGYTERINIRRIIPYFTDHSGGEMS